MRLRSGSTTVMSSAWLPEAWNWVGAVPPMIVARAWSTCWFVRPRTAILWLSSLMSISGTVDRLPLRTSAMPGTVVRVS